MARHAWWVLVALVIAAAGVIGAPVTGPHTMFKFRVGANGQAEFEEAFQAGRRACVIAVRDHQPPVDVGITVYDDANKLIMEDRGLDFAAAFWYPPREAKYKVVVKNHGVEFNDMYLVFK